jgi:hypoxia up-regulated 1
MDSEVVEQFLKDHPANKIAVSNRSTLAFAHGQNSYSLEELVAMQLVNIKIQGEKMAEEKIKELVLTVPAFWTEQERKAIIDAAELAGMRVSTLINDGLAGIPFSDDVEDSCD